MAEASTSEAGQTKKILQLHNFRKQYRGFSGTSDRDTTVEFYFSVRPEDGQNAEGFWCEVQLRENLASREGWKKLSKTDLYKALYCFAVDNLRRAGGRPTRHMALSWIPGTSYAEGPPSEWNLAAVDLKRPRAVIIDAGEGILPVVVEQH